MTTEDQCRREFEATCRTLDFTKSTIKGVGYRESETNFSWYAWKACWDRHRQDRKEAEAWREHIALLPSDNYYKIDISAIVNGKLFRTVAVGVLHLLNSANHPVMQGRLQFEQAWLQFLDAIAKEQGNESTHI